MTKILLLSPHTDDVELGCGGSVAKFIEQGHEILWVAFSVAEDSLPAGMPKDTLAREFEKVIQRYGLDDEHREVLDFRVRHMSEHRQDVLEHLVQVRSKFGPDIVIGPSVHDYHQDHQVVANEMVRAFKSSASIICYELPWNNVRFDSQLFVALEERHMERKWEALQEYRSQMVNRRSYFEREFIFGMARMHGVQCNNRFAEAFEVIRWRM
ncbi:MAG: PIG-L family deacetylase [Methanomassiliicoccus sp.]|nr:PIG-L family deacetylase [Methanomassiliicoccus sp.]